MDRSKNRSESGDIMRAALAIAAKRKGVLLRMRQALQNDDLSEVVKLAKELCGIDEQGCNRTDSRIN
jgi:hypothetical protein